MSKEMFEEIYGKEVTDLTDKIIELIAESPTMAYQDVAALTAVLAGLSAKSFQIIDSAMRNTNETN